MRNDSIYSDNNYSEKYIDNYNNDSKSLSHILTGLYRGLTVPSIFGKSYITALVKFGGNYKMNVLVTSDKMTI
jgi:hypothetical protein